MPGLDQKGPEGQGPMTGRRTGRCTNYGRNLKKKETISSSEQNTNLPENLPKAGFGPGLRRSGTGRGGGRSRRRQNSFRG